jgi:hypothetical protein
MLEEEQQDVGAAGVDGELRLTGGEGAAFMWVV